MNFTHKSVIIRIIAKKAESISSCFSWKIIILKLFSTIIYIYYIVYIYFRQTVSRTKHITKLMAVLKCNFFVRYYLSWVFFLVIVLLKLGIEYALKSVVFYRSNVKFISLTSRQLIAVMKYVAQVDEPPGKKVYTQMCIMTTIKIRSINIHLLSVCWNNLHRDQSQCSVIHGFTFMLKTRAVTYICCILVLTIYPFPYEPLHIWSGLTKHFIPSKRLLCNFSTIWGGGVVKHVFFKFV